MRGSHHHNARNRVQRVHADRGHSARKSYRRQERRNRDGEIDRHCLRQPERHRAAQRQSYRADAFSKAARNVIRFQRRICELLQRKVGERKRQTIFKAVARDRGTKTLQPRS